MTEPPQIPPEPTPITVNLIIYGDVNGNMQTVQATSDLAHGAVGGIDSGLAWLTGDFTGSGKTQIAEPWDNAFTLNAPLPPLPLALNIYGDVNGSMQTVQSIVELGQGVGALAWLTGDFLGSGKTQIAQPWDNNGQLALIIYGDVNGSMQTVWSTGDIGQGSGALAWLTGHFHFTGPGNTQIAQLWDNNGQLGLIIYSDVNGSMQTVDFTGNIGQGTGALAWLTGDFLGSRKTQIAQPWDNNGQLGLIIYGDPQQRGEVHAPMQTVWSTGDMGQGSRALAWLTGDFTGSGKTQIAQLWDNNGQLALIIYGDVNGSMQTVQAIGNLGQGSGALAWLTGDFTGSGKTQIAQPWDAIIQLGLIIYGDVNGSMRTVYYTNTLGQGPGALAWLTGDFTGSGQTQIAQPWAPNPLEPF